MRYAINREAQPPPRINEKVIPWVYSDATVLVPLAHATNGSEVGQGSRPEARNFLAHLCNNSYHTSGIRVPAMTKVILERELTLIKRRLEAVEEALAEEMSADDKAALEEPLREHGMGKSVPFKAIRRRTRNH